MKTNKIKIALAFAAMLFSIESYSQSNYNTAIGLRAGGTSGLTIKGFTGSSTALEGILGLWPSGFSATLLVEKYVPAFNVSGLNWYYGGGGHASFYTGRIYRPYGPRPYRYYEYRENAFGLGIDGIAGIEYKIPEAPIAFSLDFKPFMEINTYGGVFFAIDPGIGIKVAF